MGAWGAGSFDNDTALDWLYELEREGMDAVRDAFSEVDEEYIDADVGSSAIAAAEILAALRGKPHAELSDDVKRRVDGLRDEGVDDLLITEAVRAVRAVRERDELRDLWHDDDPSEWLAAVDDLLQRLE